MLLLILILNGSELKLNRFDITKKVGMLGIIGNIFLLIIKAVIGFISKSQAK